MDLKKDSFWQSIKDVNIYSHNRQLLLYLYKVALFPLVYCKTFVALHGNCCMKVSKHHIVVFILYSAICFLLIVNLHPTSSHAQLKVDSLLLIYLLRSSLSYSVGIFYYLTCFLSCVMYIFKFYI